MKEIERDIVSALIFAKDGKLFQGMKDSRKGGVYSDCWHIPGGGVDEGETKEEALKREIKEETGIDISGYEIILVDDAGRGESDKTLKTGEKTRCKMKFFVYKVEIRDKNAAEIKVSLDDDLNKFRWTDPKELSNLKLTPPSVELFKKLGYLQSK
jgi:8-oxo-dGTP pyrophosphatase MutT (NUDIX family)